MASSFIECSIERLSLFLSQVIGKVFRLILFIASYSPAIIATASPLNLASFSARAGWSAKFGITPNSFLPGMSFAVKTISIPFVLFFHFFRSPKLNLALWKGDLTIFNNNEFLGQ